jgi:hypothetical protein
VHEESEHSGGKARGFLSFPSQPLLKFVPSIGRDILHSMDNTFLYGAHAGLPLVRNSMLAFSISTRKEEYFICRGLDSEIPKKRSDLNSNFLNGEVGRQEMLFL